MEKINLKLPDGSQHVLTEGATAADLAGKVWPEALLARFDGKVVDLATPLNGATEVELLDFTSKEGKEAFWHSTSHIMAQAVQEIFPGTKLAIGPAIENGFYYDFEVPKPISDEDLARIEARMREIVAEDQIFERSEVSKQEALERFREQGESYKVELIDEIEDEKLSLYRHGKFVDLCRGPHIPSTGRIKAIKLLSVAGAYWRGSEKNAMLQRIYGISYPSQEELAEYLNFLAEAQRRDHRKLGKELGLFSFHEEAGPGLVFYHHKGAILRRTIEQFLIDEHLKRGYELAVTPHIMNSQLWDISGHRAMGYPMYFAKHEEEEFGVKPMNCPGHILIYKDETRSYRDLPKRIFELGTVYRAERSGVLHGLLRVRGFTQDDAHIFCTPDQLETEIEGVIRFARDMLKTFGFEEYHVFLSTRPEKSMGSDEIWEKSTSALQRALKRNGLAYEIDPGEGVFYGPKIDVHLKDAIGRLRQGPTIQVDFNMAERFDLNYVDSEGKQQRPVMIHRVVLAGIERFLGLLIEHYAGHFPLWLAPVQVKVIPVSDAVKEYAVEVMRELTAHGIRVELDDRRESVSYRIRQAETERVPVISVIGEREARERSIAVRRSGQAQAGKNIETIDLHDIVEMLRREIDSKR